MSQSNYNTPVIGDLIIEAGGRGHDADYPLLITSVGLVQRERPLHALVDIRITSLDSFGTLTVGYLVSGDKLTLRKRDGTTVEYYLGTHICTTDGKMKLVAKSWRLEGRIFSER